MAKVRRWRAQTRDTGVATVELLPGVHRVGVAGLRLDAADSNTALVGRRGPGGAVTAWISGAEPLPDSVAWEPVNESGGANIWAANVGPWLAAVGADGIPGLRVSGARQTRARYPNADPERDGFGSSLLAEAWLPPAASPPAEQFSPPTPFRNVTGNYTRFALGVGGGCAVFTPPASFWCSTGRTQSGGSDPFVVPSGVVASHSVLPHSPYADPSAATFNVFRPSHWESYAFSVAGTAPGNTSVYLFGSGGFQGGRGSATGAEFFVEGVLEELDAPGEGDMRMRGAHAVNATCRERAGVRTCTPTRLGCAHIRPSLLAGEWHYDPSTQRLWLWHNASSGTPPPRATPGVAGTGVEVPLARVLVNLTGPAGAPVQGVSFEGIGFRDARSTTMDAHAVPSGGDWALQRSAARECVPCGGADMAGGPPRPTPRLPAAVYLEGTNGTAVDGCAFLRVDGNALLAYGFHRGLRVTQSEFAWTGDTCVALWGETTGAAGVGIPGDGPDGSAGTQPVGSLVDANWFHEMGIYEKQSAAVFQAKARATAVTRNVAHNGPRAGILLNDGFGGGSAVYGNALFNLCRESQPADHGPVNFWDRQAYEWLDDAGALTSTKATDTVERNLIVGNYWTSTPVDTDDGTRFVAVTDNAVFGGTLAAKQPFAGAQLEFARNLYAYVGLGYHLYHPPDAGWAFANTTLVQNVDGNYGVNTVCTGPLATTLGGNTIASPTANVTECGMPLAEWVAQGHDAGSHAEVWPADAALIAAAQALLAPVLSGGLDASAALV